MTLPLWPHQDVGANFLAEKGATLFHCGMASGKSRIIVEYMARTPDCQRALILCPKSVIPVWPLQFKLHHPRPEEVFVLPLGAGKTIAHKAKALQEAPEANVTVMNYETAWREPMRGLLLHSFWDLVVLDESHRCKDLMGRIGKFIAELRDRARVRACLTGTPMPHSPLDIFSQFRFLQPDLFGWSFVRFKFRYASYGAKIEDSWPPDWRHKLESMPSDRRLACCNLLSTNDFRSDFRASLSEQLRGWLMGNTSGTSPFTERQWNALLMGKAGAREQIVGWQNMDEFRKKMATITYQVKTEDVIQLRGTRHIEWPVEMGERQAKLYDQMSRDFIAWVSEDEEVTATNALVRLLRLHQIACGHLPLESGETEELGSSKADAIEEFLGDLPADEPVVIFCRFLADVQAVKKAAEAAGRTWGEMTSRRDDLEIWQQGERDVLIAQIQKGSVGVTMVRAKWCLYYSIGFSLGDYLQSLARVLRPEQERDVTYVHFIMKGTIEEQMYEALRDRQEVVESILDRLRLGQKEQRTA